MPVGSRRRCCSCPSPCWCSSSSPSAWASSSSTVSATPWPRKCERAGGGGVSEPVVVAREVAKIYRRFMHQNQLKTLKSALLTGSLLSDLRPDQTFTALEGVSFEVPAG